MELDRSNGEVEEKYECMRFFPETIIYENVYDGEVIENNGAYFLCFLFYQQSGEFGVFYKDTYYYVDNPMGEYFCDLSSPVKFSPDSMTISFTNEQDERKSVKLNELPNDKKIKVNYTWY